MSTPSTGGIGLLLRSVSQLGSPADAWQRGSGRRLATAAAELASLGVDQLLVDDDFGPSSGPEPRLDPFVALSVLSQSVPGLGLVAGVPVGSLEPYHVAKRAQTLDEASHGNAGVLVVPGRSDVAARLVAHSTDAARPDADRYAIEFVSALRALWDSWAPDALVRDAAAGLYLDPAKVQAVDHAGEYLRVRGPSLTPRSPQGLLPVFAVAGDVGSANAALGWADVVAAPLPPAELEALRTEAASDARSRHARLVPLLDAALVSERTPLGGTIIDARDVALPHLLEVLRVHPLRGTRAAPTEQLLLRERLGLVSRPSRWDAPAPAAPQKEHAHV